MLIARISSAPSRLAFSLIELSIVIVILSIVAVMGLEAAASFLTRTAYQVTRDRIAIIDQSLAAYARMFGHLPCPADRTLGPTSTNYGKDSRTDFTTACTTPAIGATVPPITQGSVPVRDLNLPLSYEMDGYGSKFNYIVTSDMAVATTYATTAEGVEIRTGILQQPCTTLCEVVGNAAYIVISNGYDRRGGYGASGTINQACIPAPTTSFDERVDSKNCIYTGGSLGVASIPTNDFYDSRYNAGSGNGTLTANGTTLEQNYFDDIVVWRPRNQI